MSNDPASINVNLRLCGLSWREAERVLVLLPEGQMALSITQHPGERTLRYAFQLEATSIAEAAHILNGLQEYLEDPGVMEVRTWDSDEPVRVDGKQ